MQFEKKWENWKLYVDEPLNVNRVFKRGRHTDGRLGRNFHNRHKILAFERKTVKIIYFNLLLMHFFCVLWPLPHIFVQNFFLAGHFACVMKITFRKSECKALVQSTPCLFKNPIRYSESEWPLYKSLHVCAINPILDKQI